MKEKLYKIGKKIGINFSKISIEQLLMGVKEEKEHDTGNPKTDIVDNQNLETLVKIAYAHLLEDPQYYTKLKKTFSESYENIFQNFEKYILNEEQKICKKGKNWAKRKYGKWSAYAAMGASKYCKDSSYGKKNEDIELEEGELKKWRDENWVQSDGSPCGESNAQSNPKRCKPQAKWNKMSKDEKNADNAKKKKAGKLGKQFVPATKKGEVTKSYTKEQQLNEYNSNVLYVVNKNGTKVIDYNSGKVLASDVEDWDALKWHKLFKNQDIKPSIIKVSSNTLKGFKEGEYSSKKFIKLMSQIKPAQGKIVETKNKEILEYLIKYLVQNSTGMLEEAEYQGRKVTLNKPMQGDVKKFKVYVKDPSTGNVKKVNFGDPNMTIKKNNPERRKSFRARHNCDNPGPKTKARYWSCKKW